jgi:hypothetical protein
MHKKIAVCLSGIPKYWNKSYESIRTYLPFADVFIHIWKIEDNLDLNSNTVHDVNDYKQNIAEIETETIVNLYKPKKFIIENFSSKKTAFTLQKENYFNNNNEMCSNRAERGGKEASIAQLSMFYGIREACRLKTKYEEENNFVYDTVVRMRFDSDIKQFINLQDFDCQDNIYIPVGWDWGGINDQFSFGGSTVMNKMCECYTDYDHLVEKTNFYGPEVVFKYHLETFLKPENIKRENYYIEINNR